MTYILKMNIYNRAIEEYHSENEDGKYKLIYTYFGLAIYYSQVLEETFSTMLWMDRIFKKKIKTSTEINEIIDQIENSKKTMGLFIKEVKQSYDLTEDIIKELETILEKRNFLVHKYFKIEIQKNYSDLGRLEMLEYFGVFTDEVISLDRKLNDYYKKHIDKLGFTPEKIEKLLEEMKLKELERERKIKPTINSH